MKKVNCQQTHSDNIHVVKKIDLGKTVPNCDGLITNLKDISLEISTADCLPISLHDEKKKVVGIVHAGWRGTKKVIVQKSVLIMINKFECDPENIKVKIGPSIKKDNYLVRNDLYKIFSKKYGEFLEQVSGNQWKLDLVGINKKQLLEMGILEENIKISKISTYKNKNYPSYRRDGKLKGFVTRVMVK